MNNRADTSELANGYTLVNNTQFKAALFLLDRLKVQEGNKVLDIGCGPGNLTLHLANMVGEHGAVVGIDPSAERIALANKSVASNTSYFEGKAEDLSRFPSSTFDVVFVNSTLHWVSDQAKAIQEFARVLKPRGRLGISGGSGDYKAWHEQIKDMVLARDPYCSYPEKTGPRFLRRADLQKLLDSAGFSSSDIVINTILKETKDADEMINWLDTSSSGQTYGSIPLDLRPKAREEMKQEWLKHQTEEGIRMPMELLVTVATL